MTEQFGKLNFEKSKPANDAEAPWSPESIEASKQLAKQILDDLERINTTIIFDQVLGEIFPSLKEQALTTAGVYMLSCIQELAESEDPHPVEAITPDQFNRFARLYLTERLG